MQYRHVSYQLTGNIAVIALNRPIAMNSISETMLEELTDLFHRLYKNNEIHCAVFTSEGPVFPSCADLTMILEDIKSGAKPAPNFWSRSTEGFGAVTFSRKEAWNVANYLLLTGTFISAEQMKDRGLVLEVVASFDGHIGQHAYSGSNDRKQLFQWRNCSSRWFYSNGCSLISILKTYALVCHYISVFLSKTPLNGKCY